MELRIINLLFLIVIGTVNCFPKSNLETEYGNVSTNNTSQAKERKLQIRIINGEKAARGQFPYQVRISPRDDISSTQGNLCGGSIISDQHILTAAHCFYDDNKRSKMAVKVIVGDIIAKDSLSPFKDRQKFKVDAENIIIHKQYKPPKYNHDIAIIKLPKKLTFNKYINKISLPTDGGQKYTGEVLRIAGWGRTQVGPDGGSSNSLLYTDMKIVPGSECTKHSNSFASAIELCIKGKDTTTCNGDSGGGFVHMKTNTLIGINSRGFDKDCTLNVPKVATNVILYLKWINEIISK